MAEIAWISLDRADSPADVWRSVAARIAASAADANLALRDCVVLVPFSQLLPLAHRAFALLGGWMPRVETTSTLALSLGPAPRPGQGDLTFQVAVDSLNAESMLAHQAWGRTWARRDPPGLRRAAVHLAQTAAALARAAHALEPHARGAYFARARELLAPTDGLGARERALARIALEWAALGDAPATDRLFALRPAAWFAVSAGGRDALTLNLLGAAPRQTPCTIVDLDAGLGETCALRAPLHDPSLVVCEDFEDEAQCTAAQVLHDLAHGRRPVALISQDRILVRRVRALLERESVAIRDETGWKLATTRAAGHVMALLRAARPDASTDALFDWLKAGPRWHAAVEPLDATIAALEDHCRRSNVSRFASLSSHSLDPRSAALLRRALACLRDFTGNGAKPLRLWANALAAALMACDAWESLRRDDAGRQVLSALGLTLEGAGSGDTSAAEHVVLNLDEFTRWVDTALESANFLPQSNGESTQASIDVVIAPLAQTIARPFGAVVFPGGDHTRLGAAHPVHPLLSDAEAVALGLPGTAQRRNLERQGFAHLLHGTAVTYLRRRHAAEQLLANSPFIEQLANALHDVGRGFAPWADPRRGIVVEPRPVERSGPAVAGMLPQRLSASAFEALRECPYRFFAKVVLRLREPDELERDIEKRDYGTWLHAVLHRFHLDRGQPAESAVEVQRLTALARACQLDFGLDDAEFLPFAASFKALAPRYIEWLHERDREGQRWRVGEYAVSRQLDETEGIELEGHIDRIDTIVDGVRARAVLIDYKTGSVEALKRKVREPLEDTQLAFYAALLPPASLEFARPLRAIYLALDSRKRIEVIEHPGVEGSAQTLVEGLASELRRMRDGHVLLPLGEGDTCEYCEARGLCRRDHWAEPATDSR